MPVYTEIINRIREEEERHYKAIQELQGLLQELKAKCNHLAISEEGQCLFCGKGWVLVNGQIDLQQPLTADKFLKFNTATNKWE